MIYLFAFWDISDCHSNNIVAHIVPHDSWVAAVVDQVHGGLNAGAQGPDDSLHLGMPSGHSETTDLVTVH